MALVFPTESPPFVGPVEHDIGDFNPYKNGMIFAIDTETTGLDPWGAYPQTRSYWPCRPFMVTMCDGDGNTACIRWAVNPLNRRVSIAEKDEGWRYLKRILSDTDLVKLFHNFSFDDHMLSSVGLTPRGVCHDTYIRQHVIDPGRYAKGLKPLCKKYLEIDDDDEKDLQKSTVAGRRAAKKKGWMRAEHVKADYYLADHEICKRYGVLDAYRTMSLYLLQEQFYTDPANAAALEVYERERKLMHVLKRAEDRGVRVDVPRTREVQEYYRKIMGEARDFLNERVSPDFNPNSPKQMTKLFFGELGHTPLKYSQKGKTRVYTDCQHCRGVGCEVCQETGRNPKCDGDFLEHIAMRTDKDGERHVEDELAHAILMNSAAKTMVGFADKYTELLEVDDDGAAILHPNYKQCGPITGRMACERPNLQNVASDDSGKKRVDIQYRPRECFIPREGHLLYVPDFSQIEIWILALAAKDQEFIDALAAGGDAHQIVADMVYEDAYDKEVAARAELLPPEKLTAKQKKHLKIKKRIRKQIKCLNFGIIYGQGDELTASSIGCTVGEAKSFKAQYHERFPAVSKFMSRCAKEGGRYGRITNLYGRTYPIERSFAYRATNYVIQGSAADLMKNAMINVDALQQSKYRGKMYQLLQIHDELVIEVHKSIHSTQTMKDVCSAMSADYKTLGAPIPFPVGMKISYTRWNESQEVDLS